MTARVEEIALKPCPFCGEQAEIERLGDPRQSTIYRCGFCGCSLETGEEWSHGRQWNERAAEDELIALALSLAEALETCGQYMEVAPSEVWEAYRAALSDQRLLKLRGKE